VLLLVALAVWVGWKSRDRLDRHKPSDQANERTKHEGPTLKPRTSHKRTPKAKATAASTASASPETADESTPRPRKSSAPPPGSRAPGTTPPPTAVAQLMQERGWTEEEAIRNFDEAVRGQQTYHLRGEVVQHLADGHLIVKGYLKDSNERESDTQNYALFGYPNADLVADKHGLSCAAYVVGTLSYRTLGHDRKTVKELVYTLVPEDVPKFDRFGRRLEVPAGPMARPVSGWDKFGNRVP
jgi:hypothetical protein